GGLRRGGAGTGPADHHGVHPRLAPGRGAGPGQLRPGRPPLLPVAAPPVRRRAHPRRLLRQQRRADPPNGPPPPPDPRPPRRRPRPTGPLTRSPAAPVAPVARRPGPRRLATRALADDSIL